MTYDKKKMKVLVGDDLIGIAGSPWQRGFIMGYSDLLESFEFNFTANPEEFIEMAKTREYDALLIDLQWEKADSGSINHVYRTGYRLLNELRDYAPVRILHSGAEGEMLKRAFRYGATACIPKNVCPKQLEQILLGKTHGRSN